MEEAWRIVDPVIGAGTPVYPYEPGTWGPSEAAAVMPPGGWYNLSAPREDTAVAVPALLEKAS